MTVHPTLNEALASARAEAARNSFLPSSSMRCVGQPLFRSQAARDFACLLDFDREVAAWSCLPLALQAGDEVHLPDLLVHQASHATLISIGEEPAPTWAAKAAESIGYGFVTASPPLTEMYRLQNARDLLRYGRCVCPLGDRVRLLAALDENGTLSLADCLTVFREAQPMAGFSSLVLHRFIELEIDEAMIGPETRVTRWRD